MPAIHISNTEVASSIPFDNTDGNGYVATDVQAAIEESNKHLLAIEVSATASTTVNTSTDTLMNTMSVAASPGTYLVYFSCDLSSPTAGAVVSVSIYQNATQVPQSLRKIMPFTGGTLTTGSQRVGCSTNGLITLTAGSIEIHWSTSSGTITAAARTLNLLRIL